MQLRFIIKTSLAGWTPLQIGGRGVLEDFLKLQEMLAARSGTEVARLFAEPVITWGNGEVTGSVSWYADADGEVQPLRNVPLERRAHLEQTLRDRIAVLAPLRADPAIGPLLSRALTLADTDSVLAVGDTVVLVQWGLTSAGAADTPASLAASFAAMFGSYLPPTSTAPVGQPPVAAVPPVSAAGPMPSPAATAAAAAGSAPGALPRGRGDRSAPVWNRWLLPAGICVAAAFLALGLLLGARAVLRAPPAGVDQADAEAIRDAVARRQAENAALESQIDAARRTLRGNLCAVDPGQLPAAVPPETPITPAMRPPPPPGAAAFQGTLVDLLRQATVLVLVPKANNGLSLGSGFFIGPGLVATNRHVVEDAGPQGIVVVNARLGHPLHATVLAETPNSTIYNPDVAVLTVQDAPAVQPLSFTRTIGQLDAVVAAGFPGVLISADDSFGRLLHGDLAAMPSVILTDGRINAVQTAPTGLPILPHSAQIAPGNSGGPLVDACGRVVGINTFINVSAQDAIHINYAEKADAVLTFLQAHQIAVTEGQGPCVPGGTAAAEPVPATPATPQPQGAATAPPATPPAAPPGGPVAPNPGAP